MLTVTVDVFSGRPNPTWEVGPDEADATLKDLAQNRAAVGTAEQAHDGLGYRATLLSLTGDHLAETYGLPDRFAIATGHTGDESKGVEVAMRLVEQLREGGALLTPGGEREAVAPGLREVLMSAITQRAGVSSGPSPTQAAAALPPPTHCPHEATNFNPAFWNAPAHVGKNNCYNYASNHRTDTFAQPGRASGHMSTPYDCAHVAPAAKSDGAHDATACFPSSEAPRYLMALVIQPGIDYHWYRQAAQGFWGHKPGGTPARNTDNSGHVVMDPRICNRGPYTVFCEFMLSSRRMVVR